MVRKAREGGLAGATVLRGLAGFAAQSRIHTARILRLSADLPMVVKIVASPKESRRSRRFWTRRWAKG